MLIAIWELVMKFNKLLVYSMVAFSLCSMPFSAISSVSNSELESAAANSNLTGSELAIQLLLQYPDSATMITDHLLKTSPDSAVPIVESIVAQNPALAIPVVTTAIDLVPGQIVEVALAGIRSAPSQTQEIIELVLGRGVTNQELTIAAIQANMDPAAIAEASAAGIPSDAQADSSFPNTSQPTTPQRDAPISNS